jgi:hypothetical protein
MGYDVRPLQTLSEKTQVLNRCADEKIHLFLEHDAQNQMALLKSTEKGPRLEQTHTLKDFFS